MATKKNPAKAISQPANLSLNEIRAAIPKLERRLVELKAFSPEEASRDSSISTALKDKIDHTLVEIFGADTIDYQRHRIYSLYESGAIRVGFGDVVTPQQRARQYMSGQQKAISKIETALSILKEKVLDASSSDGAAPFTIDGYDLHPTLQAASGALYKDGHYAQAIETACKALNGLVQAKSGNYAQSETRLMDTVFSPNNPILAFNDLKDESDKDEQQGMMFIYKGAFLAFRNPRAHKLISDDPQTAFDVIRFVDFLMKFLDKTSVRSK